MDEIASHCGFTKKTQYCYFDSKDALVASIIEEELLKEKEDFYEILSINLKFYRKKYNLSQEKFADILGTTLSYLNQIENDHVDNYSVNNKERYLLTRIILTPDDIKNTMIKNKMDTNVRIKENIIADIYI